MVAKLLSAILYTRTPLDNEFHHRPRSTAALHLSPLVRLVRDSQSPMGVLATLKAFEALHIHVDVRRSIVYTSTSRISFEIVELPLVPVPRSTNTRRSSQKGGRPQRATPPAGSAATKGPLVHIAVCDVALHCLTRNPTTDTWHVRSCANGLHPLHQEHSTATLKVLHDPPLLDRVVAGHLFGSRASR